MRLCTKQSANIRVTGRRSDLVSPRPASTVAPRRNATIQGGPRKCKRLHEPLGQTAEMDSGSARPGRPPPCSLGQILGQNMIQVAACDAQGRVAELRFHFGQRRTLTDKLNRV